MTASPIALQALAIARAQIGKMYVWGASGPSNFDCSGLMWYAYENAGYNWPRTNDAGQAAAGVRVSQANLLPGDLVRPHVGHIQMYSGSGNIVEAPSTGYPVRERSMWGFMDGTRIVGAVADPTGNTNIVRSIQLAVHVDADGAFGPITAQAASAVIGRNLSNVAFLQARVGVTQDGMWGPISQGAWITAIRRIQAAIGVSADGLWGSRSQAMWVIVYHNNYRA